MAVVLPAVCGGCKREPVVPTPQMDAKPESWIRVLLLDDVNSFRLRVTSPCQVLCESSQSSEPVCVDDDLGRSVVVTVNAGHIRIGDQSFEDGELTIQPQEPHVFEVDGNAYRGFARIRLDLNTQTLDVINHVPLEPYLAGVIGAEMPSYWEREALKAQAIAARTYCLYVKARFGTGRNWDVKRTEAHQVYRGVAAESSQIWSAVTQTRGLALVHIQQDGSEAVFPAYYGSTCGGHTEDSVNVFGNAVEGTVGVPCSYCQAVAKPKFFFWPMVQFDKNEVVSRLVQRYTRLAQIGQISDIVVAQQSDYGAFSRVTRIRVVGQAGVSDWLRAEDFRLTVDPTGRVLKSTAFEIVDLGDKWGFLCGRGYGHGVGMCQSGAEGMARQGRNAEQILSYYYPGSKIVKIY